MPYGVHIVGFEADLDNLDEQGVAIALRRLHEIDEWDHGMSDFKRFLISVRDELPALGLDVAAEGDEGERLLYRLSKGSLDILSLDEPSSSRPSRTAATRFEQLLGQRDAPTSGSRLTVSGAARGATVQVGVDGGSRVDVSAKAPTVNTPKVNEPVAAPTPRFPSAADLSSQPDHASIHQVFKRCLDELSEDAPFVRGLCNALARVGDRGRAQAMLTYGDRLREIASSSTERTHTRQKALELLCSCGLASETFRSLAAGLPETGPLRDRLGRRAPTLPARHIASEHQSTAETYTWLKQPAYLFARSPTHVWLADKDGNVRTPLVAAPREEAPFVCPNEYATAPTWIGAIENDGIKVAWIHVTGNELEIRRTVPLPHGARQIIPHGRLVIALAYDGTVHAFEPDELGGIRTCWRWRAPEGHPTLAAPHSADQSIYVHAGKRLHCLDRKTGEERWQLLTSEAGTQVAEGDTTLCYIGTRAAFRIDKHTGEPLDMFDIPFGGQLGLLPCPAGLSVAELRETFFIWDGTEYLGHPLASGFLWRRDGSITHRGLPLFDHRATTILNEYPVEISENGVMLPQGSKGLLRRRREPAWYSVPGVDHFCVAPRRLLLRRKHPPRHGDYAWMALTLE